MFPKTFAGRATHPSRRTPRPTPRHLGLLLLLAASISLSGLLGGCASKPEPAVRYVDSVLVRKGERKLQLLHNGAVYREYKINLGDQPRGHKMREGDERTPEGDYILDWRNPNSSYHKSIHVSYPNMRDEAFARSMGFSPGGMIMIHGRPNWLTSEKLSRQYDVTDWTNGCIAVKNHEMDEIWRLVRDGTPIRILP
jgi:murein L,D-transpeptidase YafK